MTTEIHPNRTNIPSRLAPLHIKSSLAVTVKFVVGLRLVHVSLLKSVYVGMLGRMSNNGCDMLRAAMRADLS